jgi:hypothetical protein
MPVKVGDVVMINAGVDLAKVERMAGNDDYCYCRKFDKSIGRPHAAELFFVADLSPTYATFMGYWQLKPEDE